MKKKIFFFALMLFLLSGIFVSLKFFVFAGSLDRIYGWTYSPNIGWISLNCINSELGNCSDQDYGINYDRENDVLSGHGWSEHGGYFCFGQSCTDWGLNLTPNNELPFAMVDAFGLLDGWAGFPNLHNEGWVSLRGPLQTVLGKKVACQNCYREQGSSTDSCAFCFEKSDFGGSGAICEKCNFCTNQVCAGCDYCYEYGLGLDFSRNVISGWAWGKGGHEENYGWYKFASDFRTAETNLPYFKTVGGDVYVGGELGSLQDSVGHGYSSTYLLETDGTIIHYDSACANSPECGNNEAWINDEKGPLLFPKKENKYQSSFGQLDIKGILAGQYGEVVSIMSDSQLPEVLAGNVYYSENDFYLFEKNFAKTSGKPKASGTLVVKGDLYIEGNINVDQTAVSSFFGAPNFGIMVLKNDDGSGGNVYIKNDVTHIFANIYAEKAIFTGTSGDPKTEVQLTVSGLLVAGQFNFERDYADIETKESAEKIIYDGRVILNPPPGFTDLVKSLPVLNN
ncbi:MAG: hypothetical protein WCT18_04585 [Patescibacteria group bacterium]